MSGTEAAFQQAMNEGHSAAWEQNWVRAAACYQKALAGSPEAPQALTSLGLALIELQDYEGALRCYQQASGILPKDPLPMEKIAQLYERIGKPDLAVQAYLRAAVLHIQDKNAQKAIENWERVVYLDPENLQARSRLALIYERIGDKTKAVNAYLALASTLQTAGSPDKARQSIELALKIQPGDQAALQHHALLKDFKPLPKPSRGRNTGEQLQQPAETQIQVTPPGELDLDPISYTAKNALTILAEMIFVMDDEAAPPSAPKGLQAIVADVTGQPDRLPEQAKAMLRLSQAVDLQTKGELSQAADELRGAISAGLDHPAAHFNLGYLNSQTGRVEDAIHNLQAARKSTEFALGARLLLAELLHQQGRIGEAALEYLEALKLADVRTAPSEQSAGLLLSYELLIESYRQQDDLAMAERLCENIKALLDRPGWRAHLQRTRQQLPGYQEKGPLVPLAEILTQVGSNQVIESISAITEMSNRGMLGTAMEEALFGLQFAPTYLPMHALMGDMLVKAGDLERAVSKYQVVSRAYAARGEMEQATQYARKVVMLSPADQEARSKLVEQLIAAGQVEQAVDEYTQLAEGYYRLADLDEARNTYMEAIKIASQANLERSLKIKLLQRVADIDMQSMDWRQAVRVFEQIRTIQPDEETARSQIIRIGLRLGQEAQAMSELDNYATYMTSNQRYSGLASFIEGLLEDYPENIPLRRRLVDTYSNAGQVSEAVKHLDYIGEALMQAGDRGGAIQTIETILALSPPNRAEYLVLLNQLRAEWDSGKSLPPNPERS